MKDNKRESIISKFNFNFGIGSKSEGVVGVIERDTFESSAVSEQGIQEQVEFSKNSTEKNMKHIANIINGLAVHEDIESIAVLNEIGTNSSVDAIREMTARALVRKNTERSLNVAITNKGKGINDLSTSVAMSTINELISLENKEEAMSILTNTVETCEDEEIRENARSVKALMTLC